jgi:hypothetical protein
MLKVENLHRLTKIMSILVSSQLLMVDLPTIFYLPRV